MDSGDRRGVVLEDRAGHAGIRTGRATATAIDTARPKAGICQIRDGEQPPGYFFSITPLPSPFGKRSSWNMPSLPPSHTPHSHPYIFLFSLFGAGFLSPVTKTQMTPILRFHHLRLGPLHRWCSLLLILPRSVTLLSSHQRCRPRSHCFPAQIPSATPHSSQEEIARTPALSSPRWGSPGTTLFLFCPQISRMGSEL